MYIASVAAVFFAAVCSQVLGQDSFGSLFAEPQEVWTNQIFPSALGMEPGLMKGNGVFLSPDGGQLIATSVGGTVTSFSTEGAELWTFNPEPINGAQVRSHSNIVFTTANSGTPYMVYSVVDGEDTADPTTRVIALDMDGNPLWTSPSLDGVGAGSPVISDNGDYVFLTHNAEFKTIGYFSALWAAQNGTLFYSSSNENGPFSPPGIFHSPAEGYYDGDLGVDNTNDFIMWVNAVTPDATSIGTGSMFGFQFPRDFDDTPDGVGFFVLGDIARDFLGETAPVLTNSGRSAYLSVSRSLFVAFVGEEGLARFHFSRAPTATKGFTRNTGFPGTPVYASPALSSDPVAPFIFGGSAHTEFVRLNFDFSETSAVMTSSHIMAEAKVDPADRAVYYVELNGVIHRANFNTLADEWVIDFGFTVEGEMAMSPDGVYIYVGDAQGTIKAFQVSDFPVTPSPTASPTATASESPTAAPVQPTDSPTGPPTVAATSAPTVSPSGMPTAGPTSVTASPTSAPVEDSTPATNSPVNSPMTDAPSMAATEDDTEGGGSSASSVSLVVSAVVVGLSLLL